MQPYTPEALPPRDLDWAQLIEGLSNANQAIARYDGRLESLHNPAVLLSPLTMQEAVMSSRIEGTVATLSDVLEYEAGQTDIHPEKREDIHEILNYRTAMNVAVRELVSSPITLKLIKRLHFILMDSVRGRNKRRGEIRVIQNWIGPKDRPVEEAYFIPPIALDLERHLTHFETYANSRQPDALIQAGLLHAQFELLHPFLDGNGRLGRLLIPLFLSKQGVLQSPMFYISGYLETHRQEYYDRLQALSEQRDWTGWLNFFLKAITSQSDENSGHIQAIRTLYESIKVNAIEEIRSQYFIQAIDTIFTRPYFTTTLFTEESSIPRPSAIRLLNALEELDIILQLRPASGSRPAVYSFPELLYIAERND